MAIVRHIKTNRLYRYHGKDLYTNLYSGVTGEIKPEDAKRMFRINLEATQLFEEYPIVEEMVRKLKLVFEK
jgi:hypothetical protein